jgi:mannose-6-phosphate isomerase-like protein (cupin superfamily)
MLSPAARIWPTCHFFSGTPVKMTSQPIRVQLRRMKTTMAIAAVLMLAAVTTAQDQPAPAPPPGSAGIFKSHADLQAALEKAIATGSDMATSAIANTDQYRVNIVHRPKPNGAIAHPGNTELHYIIEGTGTVVTGGTVVRHAGAAATIDGGERHRVGKGDVVIVPAGSAHMYSEVNGEITYLEVRFLAPKD